MEQGVFRAFQHVASRLTSDPQLQKDLMQEMFVQLLDLRRNEATQPVDWYVRQCESHARVYLERARGPEMTHETAESNGCGHNLFANVQMELVRPRLSERQQEILEWLRKGAGVRETARHLGISHPAVIKHRNKIVRTLQELTQQETVQTSENHPLEQHAVAVGAY